MIHSTAADINERAPEQQNPPNQSSTASNRLSEERISNFLINSLGRLTTTEENIVCTICQEEIKLKKNIAMLSCNHIYHVGDNGGGPQWWWSVTGGGNGDGWQVTTTVYATGSMQWRNVSGCGPQCRRTVEGLLAAVMVFDRGGW
ncbi:hypothetical protein KFK09_026561 [Dendrobium nobile]|uniref:RING-type domain-containing protein n=1 Tax=Dendrobium nobile TaxID=94219 RepID=A0A8T3A8I9_DENNO|nr:hypothetical protein KFK09_026561 [Dendrobium nobile]